MRVLARFRKANEGAVGIIVALAMPVMIGFTALGTDYGFFLLDKQRLQGIVDAAALSGASATASHQKAVALGIVEAHGQSADAVEVTTGSMAEDVSGRRIFVPGSPGGAVRVQATRPTQIFFSRIFLREPPVISVSAIAAAKPYVSFAIGSKLATVSGGVPQQLTQKLLGTSVNLSVLGYDGVLRSKIKTSGLLTELAAAVGDISGTVGSLLDRELSAHVFVRAVSRVLRREGQTGVAGDVNRLADDLLRADAKVSLGKVLALPADVRDLSVSSPSSLLTTDISAAGLLTAALTSRGSGSDLRTGLDVPLLASANVEMMIGEGMVSHPPLAIVEEGSKLRTAQIRARAQAQTGALPGALGIKLDIPVDLMVASGEAQVVSVRCSPDPDKRSVTVSVRPGVASIQLADTSIPLAKAGASTSRQPITVAQIPGVRVTAAAPVDLRSFVASSVTFTGREIGNGTVRTVGSTQLVSNLASNLLSSTTLNVDVAGLGLGLGGVIKPIVALALPGLATPIDAILDGVLMTAGVRIGAVDVRVDDVSCRTPQIVS